MDTLGLVECRSIAQGAAMVDAMLKASDIQLIRAGTTCPGKYIIYVGGDRASVNTAVSVAEHSGIKLVASYTISNISKELMSVIQNAPKTKIEDMQALAVIEGQNISSTIKAADECIKKTIVTLGRLVLGQSIAGKAYFVLCGDLASVQEAVQVAKENLGNKLVDAVVIARPELAVIKSILGGV